MCSSSVWVEYWTTYPTFTTSFTDPTFWSILQKQLSLMPMTFFLQVWVATNNLLHPLIQQAPDKAYPKACFLPGDMHISEEHISLLQGQLEWREHWKFNYWHVIVPIPSLGFKVSCILFLKLIFYNCFVLGLLVLWTGDLGYHLLHPENALVPWLAYAGGPATISPLASS